MRADTTTETKGADATSCPTVGHVSGKRGPKRTPGSLRDLAEETGYSRTSISRWRRHVETADRYPLVQSWKQCEVLRAEEWLWFIEEADQDTAVAMATEDGTPAKMAASVLARLVNVPEEQRREVFDLYARGDEDGRLAAWTLMKQFSVCDPRIGVLEEALHGIRVATRYQPDIHTSGLKALEATAKAVLVDLEKGQSK